MEEAFFFFFFYFFFKKKTSKDIPKKLHRLFCITKHPNIWLIHTDISDEVVKKINRINLKI